MSLRRISVSRIRGDLLSIIVWHPRGRYVCSECPEFKTEQFDKCIDHLKEHLPILKSLRLDILHMCSSCKYVRIEKLEEHKHPFLFVRDTDIRDVMLDFITSRMINKKDFVSNMSNIEAPCIQKRTCYSASMAIHTSKCPFAGPWKA